MKSDKKTGLSINEGGQLYTVGLLVVYFLQLLIFFAVPKGIIGVADFPLSSWLVLFLNQTAFIACVFFIMRVKNVAFLKTVRVAKPLNWKQILLIIPLAVFSIAAFLPLAQGFVKFVSLLGYNYSNSFPNAEYFPLFLLIVFMLGVLPAMGEEMFIRGAVMSGLKQRSYVFAVLCSALLFSLMHGNALQTVHQFALGIVLALICIMSGSYWASVLLHFLNNLISLVVTVYIPQLNGLDLGGPYNFLLGVASFAVGTAALIFLLILFYKASGGKPIRLRHAATAEENISAATADTANTECADGAKKIADATNDFFAVDVASSLTAHTSAKKDTAATTTAQKSAVAKGTDVTDGTKTDTDTNEESVIGLKIRLKASFKKINTALAQMDGNPPEKANTGASVPASLILGFMVAGLLWLVNFISGFFLK
ncbi:MAG: CPBP family intramembrane metalloprotease [Clostridiaceae bacterium]|jgi:membrane protease YdiL (CAAX protease family)|nr:CPBP family intramembrane metalloprotease [Clostridiaceae bacterium]